MSFSTSSFPVGNEKHANNWTLTEITAISTKMEMFIAKNPCFHSRKVCSRIQESKGLFNCAWLYECHWNLQTKTCSDQEIGEAKMF